MNTFTAHGKLLLTGEYAVLNGALSLALPTYLGQSLRVEPTTEKGIFWKSFSVENTLWFNEKLFTQSANPLAQTLEKIITTAQELNPSFLSLEEGFLVETLLDFPNNWGLGSSSTLIYCVACWAKVNPYQLLFKSFGGSGYDIACAKANSPLVYQLKNENPSAYPVSFSPEFKNNLFFIHLNRKQNSRNGIASYQKIKKSKGVFAQKITEITEQLLRPVSYSDFCQLLTLHEKIVSEYMEMPCLKETLFPDFEGVVKSLGAWGGDFFLACGNELQVQNYFSEKGFSTIIPFEKMVFH